MTDVRGANPTAPSSSSGFPNRLLRLTYDPTGLRWVAMQTAPVVAWAFDENNPLTPGTTPIGIANMQPAPPNTGPILSPQWAVIYPDATVFVDGEVWCGEFDDFLLWLATNNGANRTLSAQLAMPALVNIWNDFTRSYPEYVT
jgi:hypothetical protein